MSLVHEFFLIPQNLAVDNWEEWHDKNRSTWKEKVQIDYDLIQYIFDTLRWITTINPQCRGVYRGLNRYGVTLIDRSGANAMVNIIKSWVSLFSNAPEHFEFQGELVWKEETEGEGYWEHATVEFHRDHIVECLNKLLQYAEKVEKEECLIFHYGI